MNELVLVVCYIADRQFYKPIKTGAVYPPEFTTSLGLTICCIQFLIQYTQWYVIFIVNLIK